MANLIELAKSYVPMLDEVYKLASCTSDLDGAPELARQGANANELIIPMLEMDGLADYDRNGGYVDGDVKMENRTVQCNFDRGRMFTVDTMDNAETAGLAFGRLAAEFIRTKVVPELDAFRFACYAGKPGTSSAEGTLASGADVIAAISAAVTEMDENEVPSDQRHLRITSTLLRAIKDMDSYKSREVLESFASVKPGPQRPWCPLRPCSRPLCSPARTAARSTKRKRAWRITSPKNTPTHRHRTGNNGGRQPVWPMRTTHFIPAHGTGPCRRLISTSGQIGQALRSTA